MIERKTKKVFKQIGNRFGQTRKLGSIDAQDLSIITANIERLLIDKLGKFSWVGANTSFVFEQKEPVTDFKFPTITPTSSFPGEEGPVQINSGGWRGFFAILGTPTAPVPLLQFISEDLANQASISMNKDTGEMTIESPSVKLGNYILLERTGGEFTCKKLNVTDGKLHWAQTTNGANNTLDIENIEIYPGINYNVITALSDVEGGINSAIWRSEILLQGTELTQTPKLGFISQDASKAAYISMDAITGNLEFVSESGQILMHTKVDMQNGAQIENSLKYTDGSEGIDKILSDDGDGQGNTTWKLPQLYCKKITKRFLDFYAASTTNDIEIFELPAKAMIVNSIIKHNTAFTENINPITGEVVAAGSQTPFTGEVVGVGDAILTTFDFTLTNPKIVKSSVSITDGVEIFTENGSGTLVGDQGGSGTINYATGVCSITFNTAPSLSQNITADYSQGTYDFSFSLANVIVTMGSVSVTDGVETFSDNSYGVLTGNFGGSGTVDYNSGAVSITFNNAPADTQNITSDYEYNTSGTISDYEVSVGIGGNLTKYANDFDVFQAPSDTTFEVGNAMTTSPENFGSTTSIRARATSIGDNLDQVGSGSVDFYLTIQQLP